MEPRFSESRMSMEPQIPLVLPRYPELRIPEHRISESRYNEPHVLGTSGSGPPFTTSSNLTILRESRDLTTMAMSSHSSYHPMITAHDILAGMSPSTTMAPSYLPGSPSGVIPSSFLYPHLYSSPPQMTNLFLPGGEVRTYEILGQRPTDIQARMDRPLSPSRLPLDGAPRVMSRENMLDEHRMRIDAARNGVQQMDTHMSDSNSSPARSENANTNDTSVWRPY